jgi:hypothetical protein
MHFSGGVAEYWDLKTSISDVHKILLKAHDHGSMLACGKNKSTGNSRGTSGESMDSDTGLAGGHAYSITRVVVAQTADGDQKVCHMFVKVRLC